MAGEGSEGAAYQQLAAAKTRREAKMYKSQGTGVGHRRTLAHESVLAEEGILILFAV